MKSKTLDTELVHNIQSACRQINALDRELISYIASSSKLPPLSQISSRLQNEEVKEAVLYLYDVVSLISMDVPIQLFMVSPGSINSAAREFQDAASHVIVQTAQELLTSTTQNYAQTCQKQEEPKLSHEMEHLDLNSESKINLDLEEL